MSQAIATGNRITRDTKRIKMLEALGEGVVPRAPSRLRMLHKEQQALKDLMQGLRVRMEVRTQINQFHHKFHLLFRDANTDSTKTKMADWKYFNLFPTHN